MGVETMITDAIREDLIEAGMKGLVDYIDEVVERKIQAFYDNVDIRADSAFEQLEERVKELER